MKRVGLCLLVWKGRGFGLQIESWKESGETAENVAWYVFFGFFFPHLQFLFLLNITENTGFIFLEILQCLLHL